MSFSATGAADSQPIGVAVIGVGYWGPNLIRNFQSSSSFRLRWNCDLDTERAERALGGYSIVERTAELNEVLADPEVATVAIATPAGTHVPVAMAAELLHSGELGELHYLDSVRINLGLVQRDIDVTSRCTRAACR